MRCRPFRHHGSLAAIAPEAPLVFQFVKHVLRVGPAAIPDAGTTACVGTVSVDGTKIAANASKHAAVSYKRAGELITQFQLEVAELTTRAEQADVKEAKESLDIPAELARREKRIESLKQARQIIEAQAKEMAAAQQIEH